MPSNLPKSQPNFRAEICQKFGWLFGRFEDTKTSFWDWLTFTLNVYAIQVISSVFKDLAQPKGLKNIFVLIWLGSYDDTDIQCTDRSVSGGCSGWAIIHPVFGRVEGATGKWGIAALLLAHPVLGSQLSPWLICFALVKSEKHGTYLSDELAWPWHITASESHL